MIDIPEWIILSLKEEKPDCKECKYIFIGKDIRAIGVRDSYREKGKETLFVELFCAKCKGVTLFEITSMSLVDFALDILEPSNEDNFNINVENKKEELRKEYEAEYGEENMKGDQNPVPPPSPSSPSPPIKKRKSKITLKEIKDHAKFLNSIKTHEDFLIELGMSPEDIKQYDYKKDIDKNGK
jgi:hypothetical protein